MAVAWASLGGKLRLFDGDLSGDVLGDLSQECPELRVLSGMLIKFDGVHRPCPSVFL
jgi:hypothetical protein